MKKFFIQSMLRCWSQRPPFHPQWCRKELVTIASRGYLGIGNTTPIYPIDVTASATNASEFVGIHGNTYSRATTNGTYNNYGTQFSIIPSISSGVTNSGAAIGHHAAALRNISSDAGSLADLRGLFIEAGHGAINSSAATTNVYGIRINESASAGTITNFYGIYIDPTNTGGTVGTSYGAYIDPLVGGTKTYG